MKSRMVATGILILALYAICFGQGKPDLTITESIWRSRPGTVVVVVANIGKAKAGNFVVSFGCQSKPNDKGVSLGYGAQFFVQELLPNQRRKITLDCKQDMIKGARVDSGNAVNESNEANNDMSFAVVQQKSGPIKKPGT